MEINKDPSINRVVRGKNWTDEETQVFIKVLKENYSKIQGSKHIFNF